MLSFGRGGSPARKNEWATSSICGPFLLLLVVFACGCTHHPKSSDGSIVFLLPGVAGNEGYSHLVSAIESSTHREVQTVSWGAPPPLFMLNFSNRGIHDDAEAKLAKVIEDRHEKFPSATIDLIGHSAGCGVILGAMKRLPQDLRPNTIVLLAPSVSPTFDLAPALSRIDTLHVFSSPRDTFFLNWRTSHFGTYDNVKTRAAGNAGFDLAALPADLRAKVVTHPYEEAWKDLDNDGGHFGALADPFAQKIIAPLFISATVPARRN